MDWCRSPTAVVPYKIWATQKDAARLATSVHQTDDPSHVKESIVLKCYGDEAGTGGGVKSGTHNAECTPKTWSQSVTFEGRNAVRHTDEWWMNHGNTWGRLDYQKDMEAIELADTASIDAKMTSVGQSGAAPDGAEKYLAFVAPPVGPAVGTGIGVGEGLAGAGAILAPEIVIPVVIIAGVAIAIYVGTRTSEKPDKCPCVVAPYRMLSSVCALACKNGEAHHIVPDFTKRWASRVNSMGAYGRIKGLANYGDGMAICLKGQAKDKNSEHYEAHGADAQIEALGNDHGNTPAFPKGTARIGDIRDRTEEQTIEARPDCAAQIQAGVAKEFADVNPNILGRTTVGRLPTGNALTALQNPYTSSTVH